MGDSTSNQLGFPPVDHNYTSTGKPEGDKQVDMHLLMDISGAPSPPAAAPAQEQENPEHGPPRSHDFSRTFAHQRVTVTYQVRDGEDKPTTHFIYYM